jgi:hypothetical protein
MEIDIVRDDDQEQLRLYVECRTDSEKQAQKLHDLFNDTVGGFEFSDPKAVGKMWATRCLCQLHLSTDEDVTPGLPDRGNTVAHCFARILNIANRNYPDATISKQVREVFADRELCDQWANLAEASPQLAGINVLGLILKEELDVSKVLQAIYDPSEACFKPPTENLHLGAYVELSEALEQDNLALPLKAQQRSYFPWVIGMGLIVCVAAIYLLRSHHLSGVNDPVKLVR